MAMTTNIANVITSVEAGQGLTWDGVMLLRNAFGVSHSLIVSMSLANRHGPVGIEQRLLAVAFAITQPRAMKPKGRE